MSTQLLQTGFFAPKSLKKVLNSSVETTKHLQKAVSVASFYSYVDSSVYFSYCNLTIVFLRHVKKFSQVSVNKRRKLAECPAPSNLRLHDFVMKKRDRGRQSPLVNFKVAKSVSQFSILHFNFLKVIKVIVSTKQLRLEQNTSCPEIFSSIMCAKDHQKRITFCAYGKNILFCWQSKNI